MLATSRAPHKKRHIVRYRVYAEMVRECDLCAEEHRLVRIYCVYEAKMIVRVSNAVPNDNIKVRAIYEIVMQRLTEFPMTGKCNTDPTREALILK